jgi:hypothetical protein
MLMAAVTERNFHDREGFGTAESTKSFAIMKCGGGGLFRACTWDFTAAIFVTATSCVTYGSSSRDDFSA